MKHKQTAAFLTSLAMLAGTVPVTAFAADDSAAFSGYVLMNIPYSDFYAAEGAAIGDVDAVSSATNKTGNYGKAGGVYHSGKTAETDAEGNITAVGGANGSKVQGVTWAVKAESLDAVKALGGSEITDASGITTATLGKGSTSSNTLVGYEALTEAPAYSYYVLDSAPDNYLVLSGKSFQAGNTAAVNSGSIDAPVSYGTNWGDVQLNLGESRGFGIAYSIGSGTGNTLTAVTFSQQIKNSTEAAWLVACLDYICNQCAD